MNEIKIFVKKNPMVTAMVSGMLFFGMWMYSAHQNMAARTAEREARIDQVIANGGSYHPSDELNVGENYIAECGD